MKAHSAGSVAATWNVASDIFIVYVVSQQTYLTAASGAVPAAYSAGTAPDDSHGDRSFVQCLCHPHRLVMVAVQIDLQQVLQVPLELPEPLLHVLVWHQCFRRAGEPVTPQH